MTDNDQPVVAQPVWYARPLIVLPLLAVLIVATALLVKTPVTGREGDPRLSSTSTQPLGAKLFYELAARLGYQTQRATSGAIPLQGSAIVAILDPTVALTPLEVHDVLTHVRKGGALLVVLGDGTRVLSDSIGMRVEEPGGLLLSNTARGRPCSNPFAFTRTGLWFGTPSFYGLAMADSILRSTQLILEVRTGAGNKRRPTMVGLEYERGRMVVASDPDVLRNDALRDCSYGLDLAAVAALSYLRDTDGANRTRLIFDEYHLDRGQRTGMSGVVQSYLTTTPSGRTLLQLCVAGLLLLLAAAPRVLPPRADERIERRSPLEHVDALARAYAQVGATRTGVQRLVRGLQRRLGGSGKRAGSRSETEFLERVAETKPALARDVAVVVHALANSVTSAAFVDVGQALARIEAAFTQT